MRQSEFIIKILRSCRRFTNSSEFAQSYHLNNMKLVLLYCLLIACFFSANAGSLEPFENIKRILKTKDFQSVMSEAGFDKACAFMTLEQMIEDKVALVHLDNVYYVKTTDTTLVKFTDWTADPKLLTFPVPPEDIRNNAGYNYKDWYEQKTAKIRGILETCVRLRRYNWRYPLCGIIINWNQNYCQGPTDGKPCCELPPYFTQYLQSNIIINDIMTNERMEQLKQQLKNLSTNNKQT